MHPDSFQVRSKDAKSVPSSSKRTAGLLRLDCRVDLHKSYMHVDLQIPEAMPSKLI